MPRSFYRILGVQFLSTLADNALLIVMIARVIELDEPRWVIPVLKIGFTLFYVLLAPFVGAFADAFPKGRVMVLANLIKVCAVTGLIVGVSPTWAIVIAGLGAAMYAPAKYGLITEILPAQDLVKGNGFFEALTVCGVIFGTVLGGLLVSRWMPMWELPTWLVVFDRPHTRLLAGLLVLLAMNAVAMWLSKGVSDTGAQYAPHGIHPLELFLRFYRDNRLLWGDREGGMSMAVTTLLWGVAATLQLIVLRWAHETFGLSLAHAAYLQGVTAVGVVVGAVLASRYISLHGVTRLLPLGLLLGSAVPLMLVVDSVHMAVGLLVAVGALAGFFIVPMNALLQHRGHTLLTAGRSIAVQGFNENAGMLLMLALYSGGVATGVSLPSLIWGLGLLIVGGMILIMLWQSFFSQRQHLEGCAT
jgi:MFS transporter, LPLT family, lysophospholipid transporter